MEDRQDDLVYLLRRAAQRARPDATEKAEPVSSQGAAGMVGEDGAKPAIPLTAQDADGACYDEAPRQTERSQESQDKS